MFDAFLLVSFEYVLCDIRNMLSSVGLAGKVELDGQEVSILCLMYRSSGGNSYIIMFVFWENLVELFEKDKELIGHLVQLVDIRVCVDIAKSSANRVVDKEQIRKFVPRSVVQYQSVLVRQPVGADFHKTAILRTATGTTVQPDDSPLLIRNVLVLIVPEEGVSVVFWGDLDVSAQRKSQHTGRKYAGADQFFVVAYPACILIKGVSGAPGRWWTK